MIIRKLHIDGFGIFQNHTVDGFQPGINVLYGRNESGKSTLLDFIRFTLFGYPRLTDNRRPPLRGGKHGGSIDVLLKNDADISSLFRSGKNEVLFRRLGQEFTTERDWRRFVDHAEADLYKNIYGITLDELTEKDNLTDSQMKDKIFSMGLGLADVKLGEVQATLQKKAEEIYLPRGRTQILNHLSDEMEAYAREVETLKGTIARFDAVNEELEAVEEERDKVSREVEELSYQFERVRLLLSVFDHYVEWRRAKDALKKLPDSKRIPAQVVEDYASAQKKVRELLDSIREQELAIDGLKREIESLPRNAVFENNLSLEREIQQHIRVAETAYKDLDRCQQQIESYQNRQNEILGNWGDKLGRDQLLQITDLPLLFARAKESQNRINEQKDANKRLQDRKLDLAPGKQELKEQYTQWEQSKNALRISSEDKKQAADNKIQSLRARRERLGVPSTSTTAGKQIWILVFVVGFFVGVAALFIGDWDRWSIPILLSSLVLVIIALVKYFASGKSALSIEEWETLHKEEQQLEDQIKAFEDHIKEKEQWDIKNASLFQQEKELDRKIQEVESAQIQVVTEWKDIIRDRPVPNDWTPDFFLSAEKEIGEYLDKEKQITIEKKSLARAQAQIGKLEKLMEPFSQDENKHLITRAQQVLDLFEEIRDTLRTKEQLEEKWEGIKTSLHANRIEKIRLSEQLKEWEKTYIDGNESWDVQLQQQKDRGEIEAAAEDALKAMQFKTGPDALESTKEALRGKTKLELEEKMQKIEEELLTLKTQRNEIIEQTGRFQQIVEELSKPDDLQKKMSQLESLKTQMRDAQLDWLSYRMAEEVLVQAQRKFEKEKQPKVIQNSEQYFQAITSGKYKRIELSIMDSDIRLETRDGKKKKVEELSRGTREQLLLALRLGLIEEYEEQAEDLPVALDDVFVNFDAQRASQTAEVLASFSKSRQVIIFTCHSSTVELFTPYNANILDWNPDPDHTPLPVHLTRPGG